MSDSNNPPSPPQRRKSFVEMINPRAMSSVNTNTANNSQGMSNSPSSAIPVSASAPHRRGMSMALGLSGSGGSPTSPYNAFARQRRASISTSSASGSPEFRNSFDENAVIEEDDSAKMVNSPPSPTFARRLSFGAQALRDVKQAPGTNSGEGFNWSDALRDRTKRAPSISSANPFNHNRTRSLSTTQAAQVEPPQEMPKVAPPVAPPTRLKKPDHLGERMLRGDFMMD